ncbi:DUF6470 family protein [Bacillus tianshenii]|nr:DUF6470 family protein [Bacillus tianshenii]
MMKIENGYGAIQRIVKANSDLKTYEFNIGFIPKSASQVKFQYEPGEAQINIKPNKAFIKITPNKPEIKYNQWVTEIYMKQKNSIDITAVGININKIF